MRTSSSQKPSLTKSSSHEIPLPYPPFITSPLTDNISPPRSKFNLHNNPPNNFSPRHFKLPSLSFSSFLLIYIPPEETNIDNFSKTSDVHNVWQSTKIYPPTPPLMKVKGIPLTSVNCMFTPLECHAKIYS